MISTEIFKKSFGLIFKSWSETDFWGFCGHFLTTIDIGFSSENSLCFIDSMSEACNGHTFGSHGKSQCWLIILNYCWKFTQFLFQKYCNRWMRNVQNHKALFCWIIISCLVWVICYRIRILCMWHAAIAEWREWLMQRGKIQFLTSLGSQWMSIILSPCVVCLVCGAKWLCETVIPKWRKELSIEI